MSTSVEISLDTAKLPVVATGVSEQMGAIDMDASASSVLGEPKLAGDGSDTQIQSEPSATAAATAKVPAVGAAASEESAVPFYYNWFRSPYAHPRRYMKNSIARLKNLTEAGLQRGRKAKPTPLGANTDSAAPQAAPFEQPTAKHRKQTFSQQLQKLADRDQDTGNSFVAGNRQAAEQLAQQLAQLSLQGQTKHQIPVKQRSGAGSGANAMWLVPDLFDQTRQARMSQKQGDQAAPKHCDCVNTLVVERNFAAASSLS